jgi:rhodanese-related sulfurtransferase/DNA-binding transcriptional ArsR family regulator
MPDRETTRAFYREFARVGAALGNEYRLMLLELLAQAPRHVEALATQMDVPMASISQHLQILRNVKLVDAERDGTRIIYRLADDDVAHLYLMLRAVARQRLPEIEQMIEGRRVVESVTNADAYRLVETGKAMLLDVRPGLEYEHGHIPDALSIPLDELPGRLTELPRDRLIITYCRGIYCWISEEAAALLHSEGFNVARLEGSWPEWQEGPPDAV